MADLSIRDNAAPKSYIVFSEQPTAFEAGDDKASARAGHMPNGEAWHTEQLSLFQVEKLRAENVRVVEDRQLVLEPPQPSRLHKQVIGPTGLDLHEISALHLRGPEWQGQGGLFIDIDSGLGEHPDIAPPAKYYDVFNPTAAPKDPVQHGTFTYGEVKGQGDPNEGGVLGGAPLADGAAIRVLDDNGRGTLSSALLGVEKAIEWGKDYPGFVSVNMSLGEHNGLAPADDPLVQAVEQGTRLGILFNVSAGNNGRWEDSITSPGDAPSALTYGATDHNSTKTRADDSIAWFSSRDKPSGTKPDLAADGVNVRSTVPGGGYDRRSGTSSAAPYGTAATLVVGAALYAEWKAGRLNVNPRDLVKSGEFQRAFTDTAMPIGVPVLPHNVQGAGDLRALAAADLLERAHSGAPPAAPALSYKLPF